MGGTTGDSGLVAASDVRIVVVEDFDFLRHLMVRVLSGEGYQAVGVATASGAVAHCRREQADLLITDVAVPGGRGIDIARRAVEVNPDLRVLFISGSPVNPLDVQIDGVRTGFLTKQFGIDALIASVRELLVDAHG